ncbi:MAG: T9SS type A sorting domain-containing protein [Bacteroidia bacterium]|nr:T9SS type A sorting domain-containing protein [Bacteroidia bacterium]
MKITSSIPLFFFLFILNFCQGAVTENTILHPPSYLQIFNDTTRDTTFTCDPNLVGTSSQTLRDSSGKDSIVISTTLLAPFRQLGQDIDGASPGDASGTAVAISANGTRIAVASKMHASGNNIPGHVRIFEWIVDSMKWRQLGEGIEGQDSLDLSGEAVSLSDDGKFIAIGSPENGNNGAGSGHVRIFEWKSDSLKWIQVGNAIEGKQEFENSGYSVSLSAKGNRVAIGSPFVVGSARIYDWIVDSLAWIQVGDDIVGDSPGDATGLSLALSRNGNRLVLGSPSNSTNGNEAGQARIFEWNSDSSKWVQLGQAVLGIAAQDVAGFAVSLSDEGDRVAIGAHRNDNGGNNIGHVRIFKWDSISLNWMQMGNDIYGEQPGDFSGYSCSLSSDGNRIAIGSRLNRDGGSQAGHVRIYDWNQDSSSWIRFGNDLDGEAPGDNSGYAVSLSGDGGLVAIGAPSNDGNGNNSGHVRIYQLITPIDTFSQVSTVCDSIPLPNDSSLYSSRSGRCDSLVITSFVDSCFTTSLEPRENATFVVAPNPFVDQINFLLESHTLASSSIYIYNSVGILIDEIPLQAFVGKQKISWPSQAANGHSLPKGTYFARWVGENGSTVKLLKVVRN